MSRTLRRPRDSRGEEKSAARDRAAPPSPLESERASENIPMTTDLLALRALLCSFQVVWAGNGIVRCFGVCLLLGEETERWKVPCSGTVLSKVHVNAYYFEDIVLALYFTLYGRVTANDPSRTIDSSSLLLKFTHSWESNMALMSDLSGVPTLSQYCISYCTHF